MLNKRILGQSYLIILILEIQLQNTGIFSHQTGGNVFFTGVMDSVVVWLLFLMWFIVQKPCSCVLFYFLSGKVVLILSEPPFLKVFREFPCKLRIFMSCQRPQSSHNQYLISIAICTIYTAGAAVWAHHCPGVIYGHGRLHSQWLYGYTQWLAYYHDYWPANMQELQQPHII